MGFPSKDPKERPTSNTPQNSFLPLAKGESVSYVILKFDYTIYGGVHADVDVRLAQSILLKMYDF